MKNTNEIKSKVNDVQQVSDVEMLLAEYNEQVKNAGKHTYSETLHNDSGGCCICDLLECGCDTLACCSGV